MRLSWSIASAAVIAAALLPPVAAADQVYHSEHLNLMPVGEEPLRSGFVENIKAEGPRIYAHEIFVLSGARARTTYTVTRHFFRGEKCYGTVFHQEVATLETNLAGNARGDVFVAPADVEGFEGTHAVKWTFENASETVAYRTRCTTVEID
jgi:hypothetical protein